MDLLALSKLKQLKKSGGVGYTETKRTNIFPETELEFVFSEEVGLNIAMAGILPLQEGDVVHVTWDGVLYQCIYADQMFGNLAVGGSEPDTGEPFVCVPNRDEGVVFIATTVGKHTVSITKFENDAPVKIDRKFLPSPWPVISLSKKLELKASDTLLDDEVILFDEALNNNEPFVILDYSFSYMSSRSAAILTCHGNSYYGVLCDALSRITTIGVFKNPNGSWGIRTETGFIE